VDCHPLAQVGETVREIQATLALSGKISRICNTANVGNAKIRAEQIANSQRNTVAESDRRPGKPNLQVWRGLQEHFFSVDIRPEWEMVVGEASHKRLRSHGSQKS